MVENKRKEVVMNEREEKRKKQMENESFLNDLVSSVYWRKKIYLLAC